MVYVYVRFIHVYLHTKKSFYGPSVTRFILAMCNNHGAGIILENWITYGTR